MVFKYADVYAISESYCPDCNCLESLWSMECGATEYLPVKPNCHNECLEAKKFCK